MLIEGIVEHLIATQVGHVLRQSVWRVRFVKCAVINRSADIRVSFSALLRISEADKYLLVRNLHRPESFGPFGGVYKYYDDAQPTLDKLDFKPQVMGPGSDMNNDIRGFLPRKNLTKMVQWYLRRADRENFKECLCRELKEELIEIGLPNVKCPDGLLFRRVRDVREGPGPVPGEDYTQFRIFEVYDLFPVSTDTQKFIQNLFRKARKHDNLMVASAREIIKGRSNKGVIGHHAGYLLGRKRVRPETPTFVQQDRAQI